ncbi:LysR family transcriptional regulator [Celeribacter baekdonensis]|uniref:LysR family transcriptional regulator n=1 Tax=Celeribacter baekdonensis TaxID=875171 RepID=UPI0030DA6A19|tara:strand:+ start:79638 stop:80528 length:891 start_codon:yes stop_codon:yes gene_type:complete
MDLIIAMRTFAEVAHAGSMNAAALKLKVSGALVGQRIAGLEDHLQAKLLNRTTRQQKLTEFGESYLEQCRDILELVDFSEGKASDQQRLAQGRLRIAAPVSFGTSALMPALKSFREIAPEVEIELTLSDNNEDLIAGGFDAAFRIGELEDSALIQIKLAPYRMMICASGVYLEEHGEPKMPSDLNNFSAVLLSRTGRKPWRFKQGSEEQSWTPQARISVNSGQAVRVAAKAGMGVAMLPETLIKRDISTGNLVQLLPDWSLPEQPMALIYHRDRYRPQRLTKFLDFAKSVFRNQLA